MKVLIEGPNLSNYLAKCHESFRTGLKGLFDVKFFGKGYPNYRFYYNSYKQIIDSLYPEGQPDVVISNSLFPLAKNFWQGKRIQNPKYIEGLKCTRLNDYWSELSMENEAEYFENILKNEIDIILSYFPQPIDKYKDTILQDKLIYSPASFDPKIFNDWKLEKKFDVGFLAAGTTEFMSFYPERFEIHQMLLKENDINYLWATHPGWGNHKKNAALVGQNYSKAINSCKIFITTGGILKNAHAKYIEILASKALLFADEPIGCERLGLIDGYNYVKICKEDVIEKLHYYLAKPDLIKEISNNGYSLAINKHNCYVRAAEFYNEIKSKIKN